MTERLGSGILWRLLALIALLAAVQLVGTTGEAWAYDGEEDGPGTRWLKCRDQAWADYNTCLMRDPYNSSNRAACYIAWDLDNIGCDVALVTETLFPLFRTSNG
jgi:hypothetical protein